MIRSKVSWYPSAIDDLDAIVERVQAEGRELNAARVLLRIEAAANALATTPRRGRVVPEFAAYGVSRYRELIVRPWRLIYRVESRAVTILTVVDSRRRLDELLLERLVRAD